MKIPVLLFLVLAWIGPLRPVLAIDCSNVRSSQEWDAIVDTWRDEVGDFIFQVWSISHGDLPLEKRQTQYEERTRKLISKARELKMSTESLGGLIQKYINEEEAGRRPPPGWDPNNAAGNLPLFSESSSRMVQLHLQLFAYARKHCK